MTTSQQRAALAALDQARPAIGRLDIARDPEDLAADIIEGWQSAETALRALIGSASLSGQPLIREVRQRELLTLDQAHALVEFSAAHERAQRTDYRPSNADVGAARTGYQQLEAALRQERSAPPPPPSTAVPGAAAAASVAAPAPVTAFPTRRRGFPLIALIGLLVLLGGVGGGIYYAMNRSGGPLQEGIAAYSSGNRVAARNHFAEAIRDDATDADPHIYLGRMAREDGDAANAVRELQTAIQLEPNNALAQREMGAHLLAKSTADLNVGNLQGAVQSLNLARNFYVRSIQLNPNDKIAQGFLGCVLVRLGRVTEAGNWMQRAGPGDWTRCQPIPTLAPQVPGAQAPVR